MTTTTTTTTSSAASYVQLENPPVVIQEKQSALQSSPIVDRQKALLLHGAHQQYTLVTDHIVPEILRVGEILVKVVTIGLNPVDWKGPYVFDISYLSLCDSDCPSAPPFPSPYIPYTPPPSQDEHGHNVN